jgi:heat shock protein HslJ
MATRSPHLWLLPAVLLLAAPASAQTPTGNSSPLAGTSWQLVAFQGGDGKTLTPDDGSKYTIAFAGDGTLSMRIDCNRGHGPWKSPGPGRLEIGPLAVTRAQCLDPASLHDQIVGQVENIRSYVIRNGHLFLALMADAGVYEFQPMAGSASASPVSPVTSRGPYTFTCAKGGAAAGTFGVTYYATQPALALITRAGSARPAFQVEAASGARYEGDGVLFWEAHGEAMLTWMGRQLTCKPR